MRKTHHVILTCFMLLICSVANAQFLTKTKTPTTTVTTSKPVACPEGSLSYSQNLTVDPAAGDINWEPAVCTLLIPRGFTIEPPLHESTGLHLDPNTGVIAGTPGPNLTDHFIDMELPARTVTMRALNRATLREIVVTTPLEYSFQDSNPLVFDRRLDIVTWEPYLGSDEITRPLVSGGEGPYRFEYYDLPGGFRVNRSNGVITGPPNDANRRISVSKSLSVYDAIGRQINDQFIIEVVTGAEARGGGDMCFIFVHGHGPKTSPDLSIMYENLRWNKQDDDGDLIPNEYDDDQRSERTERRLQEHLAIQEEVGRYQREYQPGDPVVSPNKGRKYWASESNRRGWPLYQQYKDAMMLYEWLGFEVADAAAIRFYPDPGDLSVNVLESPKSHNRQLDFIDQLTNNVTREDLATDQARIANDTRHRYAVVTWDSRRPYWFAGKEVADQLTHITRGQPDVLGNVCDPTDVHGYIIVSHSMGGVVANYINGNAAPSSPHHQRTFATAMDRINYIVTIGSPLQGSKASDWSCDHWLDAISDDCDSGINSLRTDRSVTLTSRIGDGTLPVTSYTQAGHHGLEFSLFGTILGNTNHYDQEWFNSPFGQRHSYLPVLENDGLVETSSQWACDPTAFETYSVSENRIRHLFSPCYAWETMREGFKPLGMASETHDENRNGFAHGVIQNPCNRLYEVDRDFYDNGAALSHCVWGSLTYFERLGRGIGSNGSIKLNTPQALRCVFGDGARDQNSRCPVNPLNPVEDLTQFVEE